MMLDAVQVDHRVATILAEIETADLAVDYTRRNAAVYRLLAVATQIGWACGFRIDPSDPDWPAAFVDLPIDGQVSWHMPGYPNEWDRHHTSEKYDRCHAFQRRLMGKFTGTRSNGGAGPTPAA